MFTWICPKCNREVPPSLAECPDCANVALPPAVGSPPTTQPSMQQPTSAGYGPAPAPLQPRPPAPTLPPPHLTPMMSRYTDAYRVARVVVGIGEAVKIISLVIGGILLLIGVAGSESALGGFSLLVGVVLAVIVGGGGFALGTLLAAHGQVLKATLDTAVNTSPFLTNGQRAEIMSLA